MKHFLITRFNLRLHSWKTAKDGSNVLTSEWLYDRFDLFQKYCLPSVINQINQNFYWTVFFDIDTPHHYQNLVKKLSKNYDNLYPIYVDGMPKLRSSLIEFIKDSLEENDDFIITTRLDNDDSIHQNFIGTIQNLAKNENELVIDIRNGFQMNVSNNYYEFRKHFNCFNAFISLVENSHNYKTVMSRMHQDWKNANSVIVHDSEKLWIEIVHGKNKLNYVNSRKSLIKTIKLNELGIVINLRKRKYFYIVKYNMKLILYKLLKKLKLR